MRPLPVLLGLLSLVLLAASGAKTALSVTAEDAPPLASTPQAIGRFQLTPVLTAHEGPIAVSFASDGRVFVAEKSGRVFAYRSLQDRAPKLLLDIRPRVHDYWDRGLLAVELDPSFPEKPYLYLLYSLDAPPGAAPPVWNDSCPDPPGAMEDGCVVSGVLSRVGVSPANELLQGEQVLATNWCHQFTSHVVGDIVFGPGRALYASAGDGSNWTGVDYGQFGGSQGSPTPLNPCGDPPKEGGALRAQDLMTPGDPVSHDGTLIRVSPDTGRPLATNPLFGGLPEDDAVVAYGLRNPYRLDIRPGTDEVFVADPGWTRHEEVNRVRPGKLMNFGWPCYEGPSRQPAFAGAELPICQRLYAGERHGLLATPFISYPRSNLPGTACDGNGSAPSGLAFYRKGPYPAAYDGALFLADYPSRCLFAFVKDKIGQPKLPRLVARNVPLVDLERGPGGDLFGVDIESGRVLRLQYFAGNRPPIARLTATPVAGTAPLAVAFSAAGSTDADGQPLSYRWDLDGDGAFDDASGLSASRTYQAGRYAVAVRVTDTKGASGVASVAVQAGNQPPEPLIDHPTAGYRFRANEHLYFQGRATDAEDGQVQDGSLSWRFVLHHCSGGGCHAHALETRPSAGHGGFTVPDHEYPSHVEVRLTATDSGGAARTVSRRVYPQTAVLTMKSMPAGARLVAGTRATKTPFSYRAMLDASVTVSAPLRQTISGRVYRFVRWSDGGPRTHRVKLDTAKTLTAVYRR